MKPFAFAKPPVPELIGLPYSAWTEKARWALEARGVPFKFRYYQPIVGEPELRLRLRRWAGKVSVPVLVDTAGVAYADSEAIARWADAQAAHGVHAAPGASLFPPEHEGTIGAMIALSERALAAGRAMALASTLERPEALREMVPKALRKLLGPAATTVGRVGVQRTIRKYGAGGSVSEHEARLISELEALRAALATAPTPMTAAKGAVRTLCGRFTFADIAAAQALAFVAPPAFGLRLGRGSRASFTRASFQERFPDIIAWRDQLYEAYRPRGDAQPLTA